MKSSSDAVIRHTPERTCIACRQVKPKRELVRIVKTTNAGVVVDETGKQAGRGAYLCRAKRCWDEGLKGNRLEYVLRTTFRQEDRQRLEDYKGKL
ncbi:MAG: YlxR family protein [Dehalococcoidales bacterium]|nr:YlxR family protein [Dehalococcoidales bacterium]